MKKINLYNIYFNALTNNISIPIEIVWFYKCDFELQLFKLNYGLHLKEYAITSFVETENLDLYEDLLHIKALLLDRGKQIQITRNEYKC